MATKSFLPNCIILRMGGVEILLTILTLSFSFSPDMSSLREMENRIRRNLHALRWSGKDDKAVYHDDSLDEMLG